MGNEQADLFFLHLQFIEDDQVLANCNEVRDRLATPLTYLYEYVIPAFDRLQAVLGRWMGGLHWVNSSHWNRSSSQIRPQPRYNAR